MRTFKKLSLGATSVLLLTLASSALDVFGQTPTTVPGAPRFVAPRVSAPKTSRASSQVDALGLANDASDDAASDSSSSLSLQFDGAPETPDASEIAALPAEDAAPAPAATAPSATRSTAAPKSAAASNSIERAPYDPIKENGEYFVGWEKPDVALVFTGMTNGYIEPCGCAGMDRMKGGLSRRNTFLRDLRDRLGWETVAVDAGQITVGFGVQEELKFDMASNAFRLMEYDAIGLGKGELRFPAYFLLTYTAPTSAETQSQFTSANVGVYGYHPSYVLPYKVIERGGRKIGVVSVVCPSEDVDHRDENILIEAPEKKLLELAPEFEKAACDKWILIVHGTEAETNLLAQKFPRFDFVVTADTPSEPPAEPKKLQSAPSKSSKRAAVLTTDEDESDAATEADSSRYLIEVGEKGKFAIVLGLYKSGEIRYQRVALDSRFESSVEVSLLMKDYQSILKSLIETKGYRGGLGINAVRSPNADKLGKYVGSKKCQSCHEDAYRVWVRSKHATAWKSLTDTATPPRDFDPECVGCHVVGWEGLQHFPYSDGFSTAEKTPNLTDVGCESCHGPGENHLAAELGDDETKQESIRSAMRLGESVKKVCYSCHDGDNSPEFDFDRYYPAIEHAENDDE